MEKSSARSGAARRDVADQEACRFLQKEIQPILMRERRQPLVRALRSAFGAGGLPSLGRLPERQRRDLLAAIEDRVDRTQRRPTPRALVRLTSVISAAPAADERSGRQLASPAR